MRLPTTSQVYCDTPRLRLRGWIDSDVAAWVDMNLDPRVMEYFVEPTSPQRSREQADAMYANLQRNGFGWFVLELRERPGFAGVIALDEVRWSTPFQPPREVGWRLPANCWGHGYATEGAAAALRYAFETLHWPEVVAFTAATNERSQRVMQRLGMTRNAADDFEHPRIPAGHPLRPHVLYRIDKRTDLMFGSTQHER